MANLSAVFGCVNDVVVCSDSQQFGMDWWFIGGIAGVVAVIAVAVAAIVMRYRRRD